MSKIKIFSLGGLNENGKNLYVINVDKDIFVFDAGLKYEYLSTITDIVLHDKDISLEKKYLRVMWTGGIINTIIYWLESGMKESIDEIATFCYKNLSVWTNE